MVELTLYRFGARLVTNHASVKLAARQGWEDSEAGEAYPYSIVEQGNIVWQNKGPMSDSVDELRKLAGIPEED